MLHQWTRNMEPAPDVASAMFRDLYWYGTGDLTQDETGTVILVMDLFKFCIWKFKLKKRLPNIVMLTREVDFLFSVACSSSRKLRDKANSINLIANLMQVQAQAQG